MPNHVLSGRALATLKAFLEQDAQDYNPEGPGFGLYSKIQGWAEDPEYGGLSPASAQHFAQWLSDAWADWAEEPVRIKDVLEGAVTDWCGGRTF